MVGEMFPKYQLRPQKRIAYRVGESIEEAGRLVGSGGGAEQSLLSSKFKIRLWELGPPGAYLSDPNVQLPEIT